MMKKEALLDFINIYCTQCIHLADPGLVKPEIRAILDEKLGLIRILLTGYLFGKNFKPIIIKYPDGWWQAIREHWMPAWWLKRYPVKHIEHNITFRQIYPDFRLDMPDFWSKIKVTHFNNRGVCYEGDVEGEEQNAVD